MITKEQRHERYKRYYENCKRRQVCVNGCGNHPGYYFDGKVRVRCRECVKKAKKYSYKSTVQRLCKKIKELNKIIDLQHIVITQLQGKLYGKTKNEPKRESVTYQGINN